MKSEKTKTEEVEELVEIWKLVVHQDTSTSIRSYKAKKCKSVYKIDAIHRHLKIDKLLVPDTNLVEDIMSGHIYCLPHQFKEASELLINWMNARCDAQIEIMNQKLKEFNLFKSTPITFNARAVKIID